MSKHQELAKRRSEYLGTERPFLKDSVIAKMLDLAGQFHSREVTPSEVRFWSETFKGEKPENLEWAFREQLRTGKFFPKPGDITELIERRRLAMRANVYTPIDRAAVEAEQSSPEWQEVSRQAREKLAEIAKGSRMK